MKVIWKAACAAILVVASCFQIGCGDTYRPIAVPLPVTTGNPAGGEVEVVLNTTPGLNSVLTTVDVSGDSNQGNKLLGSNVGSAVENTSGNIVGNVANSIAFDANRSTVFTANTAADSVTQIFLAPSNAGFAANTNTISLDPGSQPIAMSFQYSGSTYTQDYVVNANLGAPASATSRTCSVGTGSLSAILQTTAQLKATICLGINPIFAWIYKDQTKVFVLDKSENQVYVVSASKYKWTNKIPVGINPTKATQSTDGSFIYVMNSGDGTISIIDGQAETVAGTVVIADAVNFPPIDIVQDLQFNRIWVLQSNGTVSVFDATIPGALSLVKAIPTTSTPTNLALMRDGTQAYVGVAGTDHIVAIKASNFTTQTITVGVHRTIQQQIGGRNVVVELTLPLVNYVAVSRDNTKAYATTTTNTQFFYYDASGNQINSAGFLNLYNGTAVVTAVGNGVTPINTYVTTVPAPSVVTYCTPDPAIFDGQKLCPAMAPVIILGSS